MSAAMAVPMSYASTVASNPSSVTSSHSHSHSQSQSFGTSPANGAAAALVRDPAPHQSPSTVDSQQSSHPPVAVAAATTRILCLSDFPKDLKTRDIQALFGEWQDERGGFKIKWVDDTSCMIVFADPVTAKRAFIGTITNMPAILANPASGPPAKLRPYSGADVPQILTSVQNRPRSRSNASNAVHSHSRTPSAASSVSGSIGRRPSMGSLGIARGQRANGAGHANGSSGGKNSLAQAQVQELIDDITAAHSGASSAGSRPSTAGGGSPPRFGGLELNGSAAMPGRPVVGDAGKRFVAAGLGNKLTLDGVGGLDAGLKGMTIEEVPELPTPRVGEGFSMAKQRDS